MTQPSEIVDEHAHAVANDLARYPRDPLDGRLPQWLPERAATGPGLLEMMNDAGVAQAVLVRLVMIDGRRNDYLVDLAREHPTRFAAVGCLDTLAPDAADRMSYWVEERGAAGFRLSSIGASPGGEMAWFEAPDVWSQADRLGVVLCAHFSGAVEAGSISSLKTMLTRFPGVNVILDHVGNPPWGEGPPHFGLSPVLELADFPNINVKFSTINLNRLEAANVPAEAPLTLLTEGFGARRLMWGSDVLNTPGRYDELTKRMKAELPRLSEEDQTWVLGRTTRSLFPQLQ